MPTNGLLTDRFFFKQKAIIYNNQCYNLKHDSTIMTIYARYKKKSIKK